MDPNDRDIVPNMIHELEAAQISIEQFMLVSGIKVGTGGIHPDHFNIVPSGHRVLVVLNPPPKMVKGIHIPDSAQKAAKGGSGWIIAAGPLVGTEPAPYPGGVEFTCGTHGPTDVVGKQVIFSKHNGIVMKAEFIDEDFEGYVVMMTDRDILGFDQNEQKGLVELDS